MSKTPYNLANLRELMADSPAYQGLSAEEKANIEEHIRLNNKPVLLFIFQNLLEESEALLFSRAKLSKKVLTPDPAALQDLRHQLKSSFQKPKSDSISGQNLL